jgi:excisionase family DNA binding protein
MKTSTFQIIMAAIGSDETITPEQRDSALAILEGPESLPPFSGATPRKRCNYGRMMDAVRNTVQEVRASEPSLIKPGYVRSAEAAKYLGISIRTLSEWMSMHLIAYSKISHRVYLFRLKDLDAAVERLRLKAVGEGWRG